MYRNTFVSVNKTVLKENVHNITKNYDEYKYFFGVVKGDAYGHGFEVIDALIEGGVNYLAVATPDEAEKVREINKDIPLLCLEPISENAYDFFCENNITFTIDSLDGAKNINGYSFKKNIKVHLKLDTGMNRLGFKKDEELLEAYSILKANENIEIEGIYTHLATSGVNDVYYDRQIANFEKLTKDIDLKKIPIVHIGRSIILVHHQKPDFVNGVRLGICMYGFSGSLPEPAGIRKIKRTLLLKRKGISESILSNDLDLKTAFSLYSEVISVKEVKKGEFVGYGANFTTTEDMTVATLSIGYFDGMSKKLKNVIINGEKCEIIGEICMDMTSVRVPKTVKCGDKAEIFGDKISIRAAANNLGVNAYKVFTSISHRVPRIYK